MSNICFIGAGNMAQSIIGGLIRSGSPKKSIWATARSEEKRYAIEDTFDVNVTDNNIAAVTQCRIIILAVKPQMIFGICEEIAPHVKGKLIISIAAGISCSSLQKWLGDKAAIVRCMPNTASLISQGACGLFANQNVSGLQKQAAQAILEAIGQVYWVPSEELMHAVTAISGSGPAYFFLFMEAMTEAGVAQGLDRKLAKALAVQTAKGAALLAEQSQDSLELLRKKVTSTGGTTEQAILSFERSGLRSAVAKAMLACAERSKAIGQELS